MFHHQRTHLQGLCTNWQHTNRLKPDGIIGPNSWLKMKMFLGPLGYPTSSSSSDISSSNIISGSEIKLPKGFSPEDLSPEKTPEMTAFKRLVYKITFTRSCCKKDKASGKLIIKTPFVLRMPDGALSHTTGNVDTRLIKEAGSMVCKTSGCCQKTDRDGGKIGEYYN